MANRKAGRASSASKPHLMIESFRSDIKHARSSTVPVLADGAGGSAVF
jgi:hypothetical protein